MPFDFMPILLKILEERGATGAERLLAKQIWQELELTGKSETLQLDGIINVFTQLADRYHFIGDTDRSQDIKHKMDDLLSELAERNPQKHMLVRRRLRLGPNTKEGD